MIALLADFPDVNVWVALSIPSHPSHFIARNYWRNEASAKLVFNRVTALGLVRVCSQSRTFPNGALEPGEAWERYENLIQSDSVTLEPDPDDLEAFLGKWLKAGIVTSRTVTDAYLAAFAITAGHRLVSFDKDFLRFDDLDLLLL